MQTLYYPAFMYHCIDGQGLGGRDNGHLVRLVSIRVGDRVSSWLKGRRPGLHIADEYGVKRIAVTAIGLKHGGMRTGRVIIHRLIMVLGANLAHPESAV